MFVLDASVAAKWFLPDGNNERAEAVLTRVERGEDAIAPAIFALEIQNTFLFAERHGRIASEDVEAALDALRNLPMRLVPGHDRFLPGAELALARHYLLTVYDAAYLACAADRNIELVTADGALDRAARDFGLVTTFIT
ncbi:MAG TPA: type II toxin-antitoxin system VapC family toxin [Candidatus Tumulicola sp.]